MGRLIVRCKKLNLMAIYLIKTAGCGEIYAVAPGMSAACEAVEEKLKGHIPLFHEGDKKIIEVELFAQTIKQEPNVVTLHRPKIDLSGGGCVK